MTDVTIIAVAVSSASAVAALLPSISAFAPQISDTDAPQAQGWPPRDVATQEYLPVFSLMRNTDVPSIGAMGNTDVVVVGRLPPSGPIPASLSITAPSVSSAAKAVTIMPTFNVRASAAAVSSTASAMPAGVVIS